MSLPPAEPATLAEARERGWTAPCSKCGIYGVCDQCKSDIADAVYSINSAWNNRRAAMAFDEEP